MAHVDPSTPPAPSLPIHIAIIGGGPAGLRAAQVAASLGASVSLFDAKPSVGRKFLVAGRGGLNLTHSEPQERFISRYSLPNPPSDRWLSLLSDFDPSALRNWAANLGIQTFTASTGRVYPREMKAAPLLRRWVEQLRSSGVRFNLRHRWTALHPSGSTWQTTFLVDGETRSFHSDAVILALGGGSWPQTGSDAGWIPLLQAAGVNVTPLAPANCGWEVSWPNPVLALAEGLPLKNITVSAGSVTVPGELLVTRYGLEGGSLYSLGAVLRAMPCPTIVIDFKPAHSPDQLLRKLGPCRSNFLAQARSRWKLSDAATAILGNVPTLQPFTSPDALVAAVKGFQLQLIRPRPIAEAISSAGGVCWSELDDSLMIRRLPGVFVAGEMIDWEAPTGGYLMQGCFATGTRAAHGALQTPHRSAQPDPSSGRSVASPPTHPAANP